MVFPAVKHENTKGVFSFDDEIKVCAGVVSPFLPVYIKNVFGEIFTDGNLFLSAEKDGTYENAEAYSLFSEVKNKSLHIKITAADEKGFVIALFTVKRMLIKNEFAIGSIYDYPSFPVRGYIEGFYGKPWKSEERIEMMELMALFGENTHYYAPKDDPYHRNKWRELYPEKDAIPLKKLLDKATGLCIDFYYCIAPGLSMQYSSQEDFSSLCNKTLQLYNMGIRNFGLLLDDIPADLFFREDKEIFGDAISAHISLVNKYYSFLCSLEGNVKLTICPTAYHGKGEEKELVDLVRCIPADVSVFYTGSDICSKELTVREAKTFFDNTSHKPLYWDNYPVNDAEMFMEMHIGPVTGREKGLCDYSEGIISNCMEYFNCNKIPLITVASYLWNPGEYDPEKAFREAVSFLFSGDEAEDFILLSDHFRTSCLNIENSRIMGEWLSRAAVFFQTGDFVSAVGTVEEYTRMVSLAAQRILLRDAPIYKELSRWIRKFILMKDILVLSLKVLKGEEEKRSLEKLMDEYNESATVLTSFCFREYIESVLYNED